MVIGMTLCNRFMICGELQEVMINIFRTHIKIKLSVSANHQFFTVSQTIYNKWSKTKCDEILAIAPKLRPKFDGMVYAEGREYYRVNKSDKPSRLFISGNITPWGNNIYYNMAFFRLSNDNNDTMSIELEGQWIDGKNFLNVVDDSPRVFEINKPKQCKIGQIYKLNIAFNEGHMIQDGVIKSLEKCDKFTVNYIEKCDKVISKEQQDKLMLEQEIISNVYGRK